VHKDDNAMLTYQPGPLRDKVTSHIRADKVGALIAEEGSKLVLDLAYHVAHFLEVNDRLPPAAAFKQMLTYQT
jgi:hypothetical protein